MEDDLALPVAVVARDAGGLADLDQRRQHGLREQRQALARERVVAEVEVGDGVGEVGQREVARAHDAARVDARQQAQVAQVLDGVGGAAARVVGVGRDDSRHLEVGEDQRVLVERHQGRPLRRRAQRDDEADVVGLEVEPDVGPRDAGQGAVEVARHRGAHLMVGRDRAEGLFVVRPPRVAEGPGRRRGPARRRPRTLR
ncbi:MAG: hypothetical protein U1F43_03765 [Myxococcota bacterium]